MFLSSILLAANLVDVVVVEAMGGAKAMAELTKSARRAEDRIIMMIRAETYFFQCILMTQGETFSAKFTKERGSFIRQNFDG